MILRSILKGREHTSLLFLHPAPWNIAVRAKAAIALLDCVNKS
jgi:hypothetical protein